MKNPVLLLRLAQCGLVVLLMGAAASNIQTYRVASGVIVSPSGLAIASRFPLIGAVFTSAGVAFVLWVVLQSLQILPWLLSNQLKSLGGSSALPQGRNGIEKAYLGLMKSVPLTDSLGFVLLAPIIAYAIELLLILQRFPLSPNVFEFVEALGFDIQAIYWGRLPQIVVSLFSVEFLFLGINWVEQTIQTIAPKKGGGGSGSGGGVGGGRPSMFDDKL